LIPDELSDHCTMGLTRALVKMHQNSEKTPDFSYAEVNLSMQRPVIQ